MERAVGLLVDALALAEPGGFIRTLRRRRAADGATALTEAHAAGRDAGLHGPVVGRFRCRIATTSGRAPLPSAATPRPVARRTIESARAGGSPPHRAGTLESRDRRAPVPRPEHGQGAQPGHLRQARCPAAHRSRCSRPGIGFALTGTPVHRLALHLLRPSFGAPCRRRPSRRRLRTSSDQYFSIPSHQSWPHHKPFLGVCTAVPAVPMLVFIDEWDSRRRASRTGGGHARQIEPNTRCEPSEDLPNPGQGASRAPVERLVRGPDHHPGRQRRHAPHWPGGRSGRIARIAQEGTGFGSPTALDHTD